MIYLVPFDASHARAVCSWIKSEEDLVLFAGPLPFRYPLTEEQFGPYLGEPGRRVFAALDNYTDDLVGMGELMRVADDTVRLCRILINEDFRGRGMGQQLTLALLQQAFADPHIRNVELNVYDFNKAAIRCYEQCGFRTDVDGAKETVVNGKNWRSVRMLASRE